MAPADSGQGSPIPLEMVDCGICGSKRFRPLFEACDYIYGNEGSWPVAQCEECGVVLMNPRIPPERIGAFYPATYYAKEPARVGTPSKAWRKCIKQLTLNRCYGYPAGNECGIIARLIALAAALLVSRTAALARNIQYTPNGRVLDVGCGNGFCLNIYKKLGWETFGTEISPDSANIARAAGHQISLGELRDAHYPDGFFDAITLWDALEHIANPAEVTAEAHRVCKRGGRIYVYVPDYDSRYARYFRDRWFMFTAPLHYYHYTAQTLTRLLSDARFHSVHIRRPLGDAGLLPTLSAASREHAVLHATLAGFPVASLLKLVEKWLPGGHLLALALKP